MKLTKKKLRTLISEELNNLLNEDGTSGRTVELTSGIANRADINMAWPEGVLYNGTKVFDIFYGGGTTTSAMNFLQRSGFGEAQESYLGYSPNSETFFMGFDAWEDYTDDYGYQGQGEEMSGVVLELADDGGVLDIVIQEPGGGIYPNGLRALKQMVPDIIDVRLD